MDTPTITPLDFMPPQGECEHCGSWFEEFREYDIDHPHWPPDVYLEEDDCDEYLVKNIMAS